MRDLKKNSAPGWLMSLALVLATWVLYWPVRHYDFVEYDDPEYVCENQTVCRGITPYGLAWSVVDAHAANWHPLTWISHMLDCQLFGLNPGAHHLVNVLLHSFNGAVLFLLLRSMTGAFWRPALVAALFAWHPLRVESVAWISERKDVLSGFFFMLTLVLYTKYAASISTRKSENPTGARPFPGSKPAAPGIPKSGLFGSLSPRAWYYLTLFSFVLGLLSKPMVVTLPFVLVLLDYWPLARFPAVNIGRIARRTLRARIPWRLLAEKIPFLFLSLGVGLVTVWAQRSAIVSVQAEPAGARLSSLLAGCLGYLQKIFWPHDLSILYLRPQTSSLALLAAAGAVLLGISAAVLTSARTRPYLIVGWLWFVGMLLPVSGLVQTGLQAIADRYTYLPGIGLAIAVVWGLTELGTSTLRDKARRPLLAAGAGLALLICACLTRHQLGYWRNTGTLMGHALALDPNNYVAHQDLGRYYSKLGQTDRARAHRQKVRELDPALRK